MPIRKSSRRSEERLALRALGCTLDFERAPGCCDDATKFSEKTVSRVLETRGHCVRDHLGIDDFGAQRSQPRQQVPLVRAGQAREAGRHPPPIQPPSAVSTVLQSKDAPKAENSTQFIKAWQAAVGLGPMSESGQSRPKWLVRPHVRFTPVSDRTADIAGGPVRANTGSSLSFESRCLDARWPLSFGKTSPSQRGEQCVEILLVAVGQPRAQRLMEKSGCLASNSLTIARASPSLPRLQSAATRIVCASQPNAVSRSRPVR